MHELFPVRCGRHLLDKPLNGYYLAHVVLELELCFSAVDPCISADRPPTLLLSLSFLVFSLTVVVLVVVSTGAIG